MTSNFENERSRGRGALATSKEHNMSSSGAAAAPLSSPQHQNRAAQIATEKKIIDSMLEKRSPAPVAEDDDGDCGGGGGDNDTGPGATGRITVPGPVLGQPSALLDSVVAPEEQIQAYTDVHGRPPPAVERMESRIAELEEEMSKIPREERRSFDEAIRRNPMLLTSSQHARLMIQDEHFDARLDARRLARYWERREAMFGERAFSDGVFTQPSYSDYLRYYDKCESVMSDPDSDDDARFLATEYIRCVHRTKIAAMDELIETAPPEDRAALMEARKLSPEFFVSDEHKLQFLRCEDFVEVRAAERMLRYWKAKKLFFGQTDAFGRRIALNDMESHIFDLDQLGVNRLMPRTDAHGRVILVLFLRDLAKEGWTEEGFAKYIWYVLQIALEREECRRNGVVLFGDCRNLTGDEYEKISRYRQLVKTITLKCAPIKIKAAHVFYGSDVWWQRLFATAFATIAGFVTSRAVIHVGSNEDNAVALESKYGISADLVPTEMGGEVKVESWTEWLESKRNEGL